MRRRNRFATLMAGTVLVLSPVLMQTSLAQRAAPAAAKDDNKPIPRLSDGHPSFGAADGEKGVWNRQDYHVFMPTKPEEIAARDRGGNGPPVQGPKDLKPNVDTIPFQPWAKSLWMYRQTHEFEPYRGASLPADSATWHTAGRNSCRCRTSSGCIYQTGGPHSFRPIHRWRAHHKDLDPSYYGHSVGRWEGDTLVVDTVGFNERGWIDAYGTPTTTQLHLTEKFTRVDYKTLRYEITVDDPGAYTAPFTTGMLMTFAPGREQFEYMCQDGNLASELMIGGENTRVDRTSTVVP